MKTASLRGRVLCLFLGIWISSFSLLLSQNKTIVEHEVVQGETVYSIAQRYHLSVQDIYRENPSAQESIRIGERLRIPVAKAQDNTPLPKGLYLVRSGDTLYSTAKKFNVKVSDLIEWNDGLSESTFRVDEVIAVSRDAISLRRTWKEKGSTSPTTTTVSAHGKTLRIALLLPVTSQGPSRYIEFYEGFLLSLLDQKKAGYSVDLQVFQVSTLSQYRNVLDDASLVGCDMIIGGDSESSVDMLASFASKYQKIYISPFVWQASSAYNYPHFYQINPPKNELVGYLAYAFADYFKPYHILFVTSSESNQVSTYTALSYVCQKEGISYSNITMDELRAGKFPAYKGKPILMVPDNSSKHAQTRLFDYMDRYFEVKGGAENFRIFGYPEWQSYGSEFLSRLHHYRGVIYSTFFFEPWASASRSFTEKYRTIFGREVSEAFPRYNVLGYDLVSYLIPAYYANPQNIAAFAGKREPLQSDMFFKSVAGHKNKTNLNFFFVSYEKDGSISRKSVLKP